MDDKRQRTHYALQISARDMAMSSMKKLQICRTTEGEHLEEQQSKVQRTFQPQNKPRGPPENSPVCRALLIPVKIPIAQKDIPRTPNNDMSRRNSLL